MRAIIKQLHNIPKQEQHTGQIQSTQSTIQSAHPQDCNITSQSTRPRHHQPTNSIPPSQQNTTQHRLTHPHRRSISLTQVPVQPTRTKHQSQHLNLNQNLQAVEQHELNPAALTRPRIFPVDARQSTCQQRFPTTKTLLCTPRLFHKAIIHSKIQPSHSLETPSQSRPPFWRPKTVPKSVSSQWTSPVRRHSGKVFKTY